VQDNCGELKKSGVEFINPVKGKLGLRHRREGHLAEIEEIGQTG